MEYSVHINTLCLVAGKREGGMVAQDNVVVNVFFLILFLVKIVNVFYWPELLMCTFYWPELLICVFFHWLTLWMCFIDQNCLCVFLLANIVNAFYWPELLMCFFIGQHCIVNVLQALDRSLCSVSIKFAADRNSKVILECSRCKYPFLLFKLSFLILGLDHFYLDLNLVFI